MLNYKKSVFFVILTVVLLGIVAAVIFMGMPKKEERKQPSAFSFEAKLLEKHEKEWFVEPLEGTNEIRSSDKMFIRLPDGFDGDYKIGSIIKITYDGMIQETYPAIIPNVFEIELAE